MSSPGLRLESKRGSAIDRTRSRTTDERDAIIDHFEKRSLSFERQQRASQIGSVGSDGSNAGADTDGQQGDTDNDGKDDSDGRSSGDDMHPDPAPLEIESTGGGLRVRAGTGKRKSSVRGRGRSRSRKNSRGSLLHETSERILTAVTGIKRFSLQNTRKSFFARSLVDNRDRLRENLHAEGGGAGGHSVVMAGGQEIVDQHYFGGSYAPTFAAPGVFHPSSFFAQCIWEPIRTLLILYASTVVPVLVGFEDEDHGMRKNGGDVVIHIIDVLFMIDVCMGFTIGYYDEQHQLVKGHYRIAKQYLQGWFAIDFVSAFPFDQINGSDTGALAANATNHDANAGQIHQAARAARVTRIFRIFRIFRVAKIFRVTRYIEVLELKYRVNLGVARLLGTLIGVVLLTNLMGCLFHFTWLVESLPAAAAKYGDLNDCLDRGGHDAARLDEHGDYDAHGG